MAVETETKAATTTAAKPVANPGPLGLMGFGVTTLVLSLVNSNLLGSNVNLTAALPLAVAFGGGAQLLAGMWEFQSGNTFGATAFTAYGAFWLSFFLFATQGYLDPKSGLFVGSQGLATYLLGWTIFTLVMFFAAVRISFVNASLFGLLFLTFLALTLDSQVGYGLLGSGSTLLHNVAGYLGILTALNAFYNAAAGVLKDVAGKDVLPTFPFGKR